MKSEKTRLWDETAWNYLKCFFTLHTALPHANCIWSIISSRLLNWLTWQSWLKWNVSTYTKIGMSPTSGPLLSKEFAFSFASASTLHSCPCAWALSLSSELRIFFKYSRRIRKIWSWSREKEVNRNHQGLDASQQARTFFKKINI